MSVKYGDLERTRNLSVLGEKSVTPGTVKYTGLSIHLFAGASEKDTEATTGRRRVEGTQRRRYRCRAITPLPARRVAVCRVASRPLLAHFVNFAYQSSERESSRSRNAHDAGHGREMIRDIDA